MLVTIAVVGILIKANSYGVFRGYDRNTTADQIALIEMLRFDTSLHKYTKMYYEQKEIWNEEKGVYEYTASDTGNPIGVSSYTYLGGKFLGEDVELVQMKFDYESGKLKQIEYLFVGDFMSCHQTAHSSCHWIAPFSGNGNL